MRYIVATKEVFRGIYKGGCKRESSATWGNIVPIQGSSVRFASQYCFHFVKLWNAQKTRMREERAIEKWREDPRYVFGIFKAAPLGDTFKFSKKLSNVSGDRDERSRGKDSLWSANSNFVVRSKRNRSELCGFPSNVRCCLSFRIRKKC